MIDSEVQFIIESQNNDPFKRYCPCCGKGDILSNWKVVDYDIDRYHGIEDIYIWRECPHCKHRSSF